MQGLETGLYAKNTVFGKSMSQEMVILFSAASIIIKR
jgi:hypothetical protein